MTYELDQDQEEQWFIKNRRDCKEERTRKPPILLLLIHASFVPRHWKALLNVALPGPWMNTWGTLVIGIQSVAIRP